MAIFTLLAKLGLDTTDFQAGIKKAQSGFSGLGASLRGALNSQAAGLVGAAAFTKIAHDAVALGGTLVDLRDRTGVSIEALQEMGHAAKLSGSSLEELTGFLEKLNVSRQEALSNPGGDLAKTFASFGVTIKDLKSARVEDIAKSIAKVFESGDPQKLIGPLREIGGRGASGLIPAFSAGLADAAQNARELGVVMSEDVAESLDEVGDKMDTLGQRLTISMAAPLVALVTGLKKAYDFIDTEIITRLAAFVSVFKGELGPGTDIKPQDFMAYMSDLVSEERERKRLEDEAQAKIAQKKKDARKAASDGSFSASPSSAFSSGRASVSAEPIGRMASTGGFFFDQRSGKQAETADHLRKISDNTRKTAEVLERETR